MLPRPVDPCSPAYTTWRPIRDCEPQWPSLVPMKLVAAPWLAVLSSSAELTGKELESAVYTMGTDCSQGAGWLCTSRGMTCHMLLRRWAPSKPGARLGQPSWTSLQFCIKTPGRAAPPLPHTFCLVLLYEKMAPHRHYSASCCSPRATSQPKMTPSTSTGLCDGPSSGACTLHRLLQCGAAYEPLPGPTAPPCFTWPTPGLLPPYSHFPLSVPLSTLLHRCRQRPCPPTGRPKPLIIRSLSRSLWSVISSDTKET